MNKYIPFSENISIDIFKTKYKLKVVEDVLRNGEGKKGLIIFRHSENPFVMHKKFSKSGYKNIGFQNKTSDISFIDEKFYKENFENNNEFKFDFILDYNFLKDMNTYINRLKLLKSTGKYTMIYSNRDLLLIKDESFANFDKKQHRRNLLKLGELNWYVYTSNADTFMKNLKSYIIDRE